MTTSRGRVAGSWSIATTGPAPAVACWTGAAVLLGLAASHLDELGAMPAVVSLVVAAFMANWGRLAWVAWRRQRPGERGAEWESSQ